MAAAAEHGDSVEAVPLVMDEFIRVRSDTVGCMFSDSQAAILRLRSSGLKVVPHLHG